MKSDESYRTAIDRKANAVFARRKQRKRLLCSLIPATGCVAAVCAALVLSGPVMSSSLPPVSGEPAWSASPGVSETAPASSAAPTVPALPEIPAAALGNSAGANRRYYDPAKTYQEKWDTAQIAAYLGRDITPGYLPDGLVPSDSNGAAQVVRYNGGAMAYDVIWMSYSAPMPDSAAEPRPSVRITASRIGLECDLMFDWPEDAGEVTLSGTSVRFGLWQPPYYRGGSEPAGYESVYVAKFTRDGVGFQVLCQNLRREDALRVVCSLVGAETADVGLSPAGLDSAACA